MRKIINQRKIILISFSRVFLFLGTLMIYNALFIDEGNSSAVIRLVAGFIVIIISVLIELYSD